MRVGPSLVIAVLFILSPVGALSQTRATPRAATDLDHAEVEAHLRRAVEEGITDRILALVDIGAYNVAGAVVIRRRPSAASEGIGNIGRFSQHDKITEV